MAAVTKIHLPYSKKNVTIPSRKEYFKKAFNAISKLVSKMGWEVYQELYKDRLEEMNEEEFDFFGFKSGRAPPTECTKVLQPFLKELMDLFRNIEFRESTNDKFQEELEEWLSENLKPKELLISADKTMNFYRFKPKDYQKLLDGNVTESYKKVTEKEVHDRNLRAKNIVVKLHEKKGAELSKRVEVHSADDAFVTIKDHDKDFRSSKVIPCRLINPAKSQLGKISKMKLEGINEKIRAKTKLNQWQSNREAKAWFKALRSSKKLSFLVFDIKSFYPSITPELLENAIRWAEKFETITEQDKELFRESRRALLHHGDRYWTKIKNPEFDVPMGAYDGAECCELCGLFLLDKIISANIGLTKENCGIYRDDGLAATEANGQSGQRMVQELRRIFLSHGLRLSKCEHGLKSVDFLDLTFNLDTHTFEPFRKEDNQPLYIHKHSNHPKSITKQIPKMICQMISENSSNEEIFNRHKGVYEEALRRSGYKGKMRYTPPTENINRPKKKKKKERYPKKFFFNPPYNKEVYTNVGKRFLAIISRCFPRGSEWSGKFNRHTIKLSYSCTKNLASKIAQHNAKVMNGRKTSRQAGCNCRKKDKENCPIPNNCLAENVVYSAVVESEGKAYNYYGMTSMTFKDRYNKHKYDFRWEKGEDNGTALSAKVWQLKKEQKKYSIKWSIVDKAFPYKAGGKMCDLCSTERMYIALAEGKNAIGNLPDNCTQLNVRSEIMGKCRHRLSQTLSRVKEKEEDE